MRQRDDGSCVFLGWTASRDNLTIPGRWVELSAPDITAEEDVPYQIMIETDARCRPVRIRYWVNGRALADSRGESWFSTRAGSLDPAVTPSVRLSRVVLTETAAHDGLWGDMTVKPVPRTDVMFPIVSRPLPGTELTFAVVPKDGVTLTGDLACRWYRVDASGQAIAGAERGTGETCAISSDDFGHYLAVDVADANGYLGTGRFWCSNLPVVMIDVENAAWPTAAKEEHAAKIHIGGNATYKVQYDKDGQLDTDGTVLMSQIKVRGNSTAGADKKPYKIKLGKKADLFGFGKNKHWVLLANCFDESLMRNKIAYDLSAHFGIPAMKSEWVDVVLNGEYVGNYLLCQHIRIAEERVNITDISDTYDTEGVDITGGYIFEIDAKKAGPDATSPAASQCLMIPTSPLGALYLALSVNTPEFCFANSSISNYVCTYWTDVAQTWLSGTGYNAKGDHYTDLCDFDSMVGYWLSLYVPGNDDAAAYSRYAYKDRGGKLFFGPAWDFDYGMGSLQIRSRLGTVTNDVGDIVYAPIAPEQWVLQTNIGNFMGYWTQDPTFIYHLREKYAASRETMNEIVRDGGLIDRYAEKLAPSARANDLRWNNRIGFFGNAQEPGDVQVLKDFLTRRFAWLDGQFGLTDGQLATALENLPATVASVNLRTRRTVRVPGDPSGAPLTIDVAWLRRQWQVLVAADPMFATRVPLTSDADYAAFAALRSPIGKPTAIWEDFIADTDPTRTDDRLTASIDFADGEPVVRWQPDRRDPNKLVVRHYRLVGTDDLATPPAQWESLPVDGRSDAEIRDFCRRHRFFKVEVAMP